MKRIFTCLVLGLACCFIGNSQVGIGTNTPNGSSILELQSNNKGLLIPRVTAAQRNNIATPANGLIVFDLDSSSLFIYAQSSWKRMKPVSVLDHIIAGTSNGDMIVWNGTQWELKTYRYYYRDKDGDGLGDKYQPVGAFVQFPGFVTDSTDCNDNDPAEVIRIWYRDQDADGYGSPSQTTLSCTQPVGYVINNTDCNDTDSNINSAAVDNPDDGFADSNCDGVDGTESQAIFVAPTGSNSNPGTKALPVATINFALTLAQSSGKTQVFVSNGNYNERVILLNGISIYGGYSAANNWTRAAIYNAVITGSSASGRISGIEGNNIILSTTLDRLQISTPNATGNGISNYGMICNSCTGVILKNSSITAGNGSSGLGGTSGGSGAIGLNGIGGFAGNCDNNVLVQGGSGGFSSCGRTGGNGGNGGAGPNNGQAGGTGTGGTFAGNGGAAGNPGHAGNEGGTGSPGGAGGNGSGGFNGSIVSGFWVTTGGLSGTNGTAGNGGGGGGGGGGEDLFIGFEGSGNGGGGGGGGGCAGTFGSGGSGGGGSFGLFLVSSTGFQVISNSITSANGGAGGNGGTGGNGGAGGNGGPGGTTCITEVGQGGNGGNGGNGGRGGHGGGGAGGPTYSIYRSSTTLSTSGNTLSFGTPGAGGNSPGSAGTAGGSGTIF